MSKGFATFKNGIIHENPIFRLVLGTCPTLAVTTAAINGLGMGIATMLVLVASNVIISMLRNVISDKVRIPSYIILIAGFTTIVQILMQAYVPELYASLGIYIPLIVVNCIILGRAEAFAAKNGPISSIFDGIGMGLGFTLGLTLLGGAREILGTGAIFGCNLYAEDFGMLMFVLAPGAFLVLGYLIALVNKIKK